MCNPKPSSPSSFISSYKTHFTNPDITMDHLSDTDQEELHRWPTFSEVYL